MESSSIIVVGRGHMIIYFALFCDFVHVLSSSSMSNSDSDSEAEQGPSRKKQARRLCKFQDQWLSIHSFKDWLRKCNTEDEAYCSNCNKTFTIKFDGIKAIRHHAESVSHVRKVQAAKQANTMLSYFKSNTATTKADDDAVRAELILTYHGIRHNHSYSSQDCGNKIVKTVFSDSKVALKMHCGRTKAEALVENVLAPYSIETMLKKIGKSPIGIATDASNKGNQKMFPVAIRFFDLKAGTSTFILDFYEDHNETSEAIANKLLQILKANKLSDNKLVSYGADNAAVNYGKHKSVFVHLKNATKNTGIIPGHCSAHIIHNTAKQALKPLSYDVECLVLKIYSEFSSSAKRVAELKEFFEFMDTEYVQLLGHVSVRFLTLLPALDRILASWDVLKSYFQSAGQENVSQLVWKFVASEKEGDSLSSDKDKCSSLPEFYIYFAHSILSILTTALKRLESEYIQPTEVYNVFYNLKTEFENRLNKQFFGFICSQNLHKLTDEEKVKFKQEALMSYEKVIAYLEKWFDFGENSFYRLCQPFNLDDELEFNAVMAVVNLMKIDVDGDALFSEICVLNSVRIKLKEKFTSSSDLWVDFFKNSDSPNLLKIVQHIFAVPPHNAYVERAFSIMKNLWTDERNRLNVGTVKAELQVHLNFNMTCGEFADFIRNNCPRALLLAAKSEKKYKFITH